MPLTANFSLSQTIGFPNIVTIVDTSTGSDANIAERLVYFQRNNGLFLVEGGGANNYNIFPLSLTTKDFDVLNKDYALNVKVDWVNASKAVLYTKTVLMGFTLHNEGFLYEMTQAQNSNPNLVRDVAFYDRKTTIRESVDSGNQAISFGSDIQSAQVCYDVANNLRENQAKYF